MDVGGYDQLIPIRRSEFFDAFQVIVDRRVLRLHFVLIKQAQGDAILQKCFAAVMHKVRDVDPNFERAQP